MKITVNKTKKYPYVGSHKDGAIVLFTSVDRGVCLQQGIRTGRQVGKYAINWFELNFKPITGTITIECP